MKIKVKYILLIVLLLVIGINKGNASTYNGKLYELWHPDSGFNVFAEESNRYMDYNSWMIKSTIDDKIYYCIDPATPLEGSYQGSHNIYTNKTDIIKHTSLNEEKYKKVQLLAYYGYGYKDNKIDHTNKKWYGITQVMIWRVVRPDLTWTFKENRNASPNPNLYKNEVSELNNLINNYYKTPSFANEIIKMNAGDSIVVNDANKVLDKYTIMNSSKHLNLSINDNKLNVYSDFSSLYSINFEIKPNTNEIFGALVSSDFQDIIKMGAPEKQTFKTMIEVDNGFVKIQKNDTETKIIPQGEATLKGAVYKIYNNNFEKLITTDENGYAATGLLYGSYKIKEEKSPKGYKLNNKIYDLLLNGTYNYVTVNVEDKVIKGTIKINKTKGGADEKYVPEEEAVFEVLDKNNNKVEELITNNEGIAMIDLPYGTYIIRQTKGEEGYINAEDIQVIIEEDKVYNLNIKNIKKSVLVFSKTDYSLDILVANCLIEIYKEDNSLVYSGKTDKMGKIILPDLDIGKYYILEKEAPKYYKLNSQKMFFEVKEHGKVIKANMKNYRKEGSLKIKKQDKKTNKYLEGAEFDIYQMDINKVLFKGKTNKKGELNIKNIIAGKYCVVETKAPDGYKLNKNKYCIEIEEDNQEVELLIKNEKNDINVPKTSSFNIISIVASLLILSGTGYLIYEKYN